MSGLRDAAEAIAEEWPGFRIPNGLDDDLEPGEPGAISDALASEAERILSEASDTYHAILALAEGVDAAAETE